MNPNESENYSYIEDYTKSFCSVWDELIDWEKRCIAENGRISNILKEKNCSKILDVATGTGFHSLNLIRDGFNVVSIDGSINMLDIAKKNADLMGLTLDSQKHDWRFIPESYFNRFDAIICLGNSFTHLNNEEERRIALKNFYATLKPGGFLLLDHRNYEKIKKQISTKNETGNVYCGSSFKIKPAIIDEKIATFEYKYQDKETFLLHMYTLYYENINNLLLETGFKENIIQSLHNKNLSPPNDEIDFILHIAQK